MTEKKGSKNRILLDILPFFLAFLGTVSFWGISAIKDSEFVAYANSMLAFLIFAGGAYLLKKEMPEFCMAGKRKHIYATIFSFLFSMAMQLGACMEVVENIRITEIWLPAYTLSMTAFMTPIVNAAWDKVDKLLQGTKNADKAATAGDGRVFSYYQIWAILFLLWMPTMLALYPGAFVYDAQDEYVEVISRSFTMHHPLIHVLLLGGIIHAAEYIGWTANTGIAIYVILQMTVVSAILAYSIKLFEKWGMKKKVLIGVMAFYGIFPLFPLYSVCTAKDTLFSAFFLLLVLLLVDIEKGSFFEMKEMLLFTLASVLMMLFRNNGMYAYLVALPIIYLILRVKGRKKNEDKEGEVKAENTKKEQNDKDVQKAFEKRSLSMAGRLAILMILSLLIFAGSNYILKTVTNAEDGEHQEMLTVPIQQLARVYTYSEDVFSKEDIETLHEVLPEEYLLTYRLRISDVLKSGFRNDVYSKNPAKYRALWLKIGLKKPLIYLNAWLGTSYGYWYPDAINNVYAGNQMYTFQYTESSYFGFETEPPGERDSKFKILELFYEKMSLSLFQQKVPVVSMFFSPGFLFWVFAFVFTLLIREKRTLVPLIPVLLLWLTVLLGPTTIVRYVFILWLIVPLYPVLFYSNKKG